MLEEELTRKDNKLASGVTIEANISNGKSYISTRLQRLKLRD